MDNLGFYFKEDFNFLDRIIRSWRLKPARQAINLADNIVDLGCGQSCKICLENYNKINSYTGIDKEVDNLNLGKVKLIKLDLDRADLPIMSNSIDKIFAFALVEHLGHPDKCLSECHRILKKLGFLYLTTPTPKAKGLLELLAKFNLIKREDIVDHKQYFSPNRLGSMLSDIGFNVKLIKKFELGLNCLYVVQKL